MLRKAPAMTLLEQQMIFARNVAKLLSYISKMQFSFTLGEVYRTPTQAALYAQEGKGITHSLHCDRLAIDIFIFKDKKYLTDSEDYATIGAYWKTLHILNGWGGDFKTIPDGNHFQMQLYKG